MPDHDPVVTRGASVAFEAVVGHIAVIVAWMMVPDRRAATDEADPGGVRAGLPRHLCALSACDRLLRTSRAFLI
ncbi:MAG: hypothetical protein SFY69_04455 [Planctomycetota bacterium]|nr:hypothetical protein [Planctomycetota bacterium]